MNYFLFTIYSLDFSMLNAYYPCNNRKLFVNKMLLQIHKYIKQRGSKGHTVGSESHTMPGRGQHERPEGWFGLILGAHLLTWRQESIGPWQPWEQGACANKAKAKHFSG